jgi:uncharacterized protein (DUF1330 family)
MAAYLLVDVDITDPVRYEVYKELAAPTLALYGGKYVARGGAVENLEGAWQPGRIVIVEFPSTEHAKNWWNSDAYKTAKKLRQETARTNMILVEGI